MARKRCLMNDLVEGMKLEEDVLTEDGQLLVVKGTVVTPKIIARLKFYSISYVYIENNVSAQKMNVTYYKKIESTYEFKKFNHTLRSSVQNLQKSINHAILYNEEIDTDEVLESVNSIITDTRNGMHIMNMLQCIRSYDDMTYVHCVNVSLICSVMAEWMNMSPEDKKVLALAGVLHDVGKIIIPNEILTKTGKLTEEEYEQIKGHALRGYELIKNKNLDERVKLAVLQHHERCDGKGYPFGLKSEHISEFAKIIAIADVYDAMTSNRVYRQGICPFDVIETFEKEGFQKYDPKYLLPFLERISQCYLHTNVMLSDGKEGEVIMVHNQDLGRPVIKVEDSYIDLAEQNDITIKNLV